MTARKDPRHKALDELDRVFGSPVLAALAEKARVDLLKELAILGRVDVKTLSERLPQHTTVISRHLKALHEAGLLRRTKKERWVYYEIDGQEWVRIFREMLEAIEYTVETCDCGEDSASK
ncbi:MAG: winged helix-turn-helix transcriptional regulator [Leptospiraceae bacterium]|nr:winged helix-turn-helix transcriptional regulator [Leptospiraceae bacterium]MCB1171506.1 winged helix-turn-helix transcriptional regulator [Leptospiraceae bacterium]